MDYLNQTINTKSFIENFGDGLIMFKTSLKLNVAKFDFGHYINQDIQQDKPSVIKVGSDQSNGVYQDEELSKAAGEPFLLRKKTQCAAIATVYGVSCKVSCTTPQHAHFGMNRKYLTNEGLPNETAIIKRLRELGLHHDVKEARFGQFYNLLFTKDYYDNMTALFAKLHLTLNYLEITQKMKTYKRDFVWKRATIKNIIVKPTYEDKLVQLHKELSSGTCAVGHYDSDANLDLIIEKMVDWVEKNKNDETQTELVIQMSVWHMYSYEDGHSRSGKSFGNEFGFKNNDFLIPYNHDYTNSDTTQIIVKSKDNWFSDENMERYLKKVSGYLNLSGFTNAEISILNHILVSPPRQTPFLCDQHIPLLSAEDKVLAVSTGDIEIKDIKMTPELLKSTISKLAMNHRSHEDLLSAIRACKYWLAQPATETVESHWWTTNPRSLFLPKLGLKRATLHFMLEDEAVCMSHDSIKIVRNYSSQGHSAIIESAFANTCWYWGEYMAIFNKVNLQELISSIRSVDNLGLDSGSRADVLYSAVLGKAVPLPAHTCCHTAWSKPMVDMVRRRVTFGLIDFDYISDYGYEVNNNDMILNSMAAPSCVALITGLAGSLLTNTPYGSLFTMNCSVRKLDLRRNAKALNYNDLWAFGVISRFNGYDVKYLHPNRAGRHTIYASNSVMLAMPPVNPSTLTRYESYTILGVMEREKCFGSNPEIFLNGITTFYWNRSTPTVQSEPLWTADPCFDQVEQGMTIRGFNTFVDESKKYTVALISEYNMVLSDFHVEYITAGVPLPTVEEGLLLDEEVIEDQPAG
uniref:Coat protein n=1 Tax=Erysiphales associated totivirus 6 TaxID=2719858 RepID=A0A6G9ELN8_9VIRU|nr:coat protein [Erysiphales associated totivirus 6]